MLIAAVIEDVLYQDTSISNSYCGKLSLKFVNYYTANKPIPANDLPFSPFVLSDIQMISQCLWLYKTLPLKVRSVCVSSHAHGEVQ